MYLAEGMKAGAQESWKKLNGLGLCFVSKVASIIKKRRMAYILPSFLIQKYEFQDIRITKVIITKTISV